jgi:hypothetical protein
MEYIAHEYIAFFITAISFEKTQSAATFAKVTCELLCSEQSIAWAALPTIRYPTNGRSRIYRFSRPGWH